MANVAILRLLSAMRFSRSTLQEVTVSGWIMAMRFSVFTAENLMVGLADVRNICKTIGERGEGGGEGMEEGEREGRGRGAGGSGGWEEG